MASSESSIPLKSRRLGFIDSRRLLVVSHPSALQVNQFLYEALKDRGWELLLVVPANWQHEFSPARFASSPLPNLKKEFHPLSVIFAGYPQRHIYIRSVSRVIREWKPKIAFIEEEAFSLAAAQWGIACRHRKIPFGVQCAENLERDIPLLARLTRTFTLSSASFVAARSPSAAKLAVSQGAVGPVSLIPHYVPPWQLTGKRPGATFTVGFAGRLVTEKGLQTLVEAIRLMGVRVDLLVAGDGPLRNWLESADLGFGKLRILTGLSHSAMADAYTQMDVLVLPSLTTKHWVEQFGRVLVEAMSCGVPVVGSNSGEIPWVIETTGGGRIFPEGDARSLAALLIDLCGNDRLRTELAAKGRTKVQQLFSVAAAADMLEQTLITCLSPQT